MIFYQTEAQATQNLEQREKNREREKQRTRVFEKYMFTYRITQYQTEKFQFKEIQQKKNKRRNSFLCCCIYFLGTTNNLDEYNASKKK